MYSWRNGTSKKKAMGLGSLPAVVGKMRVL